MSITRPPAFVSTGAGRPLPSPWREAPVAKIGGSSTGGAYSVAELSVDWTWRRPSYVHHALDECFYVVSGSVIATVEGMELPMELSPGSVLFVPRGLLRSLRAGSTGCRLLIVVTPAEWAGPADPAEGIEFAEHPVPLPPPPPTNPQN